MAIIGVRTATLSPDPRTGLKTGLLITSSDDGSPKDIRTAGLTAYGSALRPDGDRVAERRIHRAGVV